MLIHNLPPQSTPFIGRGAELAEAVRLLAEPNCRLLTLLGPGGIGKTRLATKIGHDIVQATTPMHRSLQVACKDGVYFVPLQPLILSDFNLSALVDALRIKLTPDSDVEDQVLRYLQSKSLLLILDNFEHLLDGVELISRLLVHAPGVKVLVTSREVLNLQEEWLLTIRGMAYPQVGAEWSEQGYDAVQFFVGNAQRLSPEFSVDGQRKAIANICQLVEGMPLALELAASWTRSLSCAEIVDELGHGLDILETRASNVPERHRTMRTVLDHSWNFLSNTEQDVFKKLSVFRGGFTRESAQAVANATRHSLAKLVDKCWLRHDADGRYDIHELLRQYGEERLNEQPDVMMQAHDRHCGYFSDFLAIRREGIDGARAIVIIREIHCEFENIRGFWRWALLHHKSAQIGQVIETLWSLFEDSNRFQEGEAIFGQAVQTVGSQARTRERDLLLAKLQARQGGMCQDLDRHDEARILLHEALKTLESSDAVHDLRFCLLRLGILSLQVELIPDRAREYFQRSLANEGNITDCHALLWLGLSHNYDHNWLTAYPYLEEALAIARKRNYQRGIAEVNIHLGRVALELEHYDEARLYFDQSITLFKEMGTIWGVAMSLRARFRLEVVIGQINSAKRYAIETILLEKKYNLISHTLSTLYLIAYMWSREAKTERALELLEAVCSHSTRGDLIRDAEELIVEIKTGVSEYVVATTRDRARTQKLDDIVQEVLLELQDAPQNHNLALADPLTNRELDILRLMGEGSNSIKIAHHLVLSVGTVRWYIKQIYSKLGVHSRSEALVVARELHLIS